eukprot:15905404-Heterocapsa_arctica.AAC.1
MDWTMKNGRMLIPELQLDRVVPAVVAPLEAEYCENMKVMVMQSETPMVRTCATPRVAGEDITPDDLKQDCRNEMCLTCAARDPNSGYNKK